MTTVAEIDQVLELDKQAKSLKEKQREIALDYLRKVIASFNFTPSDLFNTKNNFRDGSLATLRAIFDKNHNIGRKEFLELARKANVNEATASTQYSRIKRERGLT